MDGSESWPCFQQIGTYLLVVIPSVSRQPSPWSQKIWALGINVHGKNRWRPVKCPDANPSPMRGANMGKLRIFKICRTDYPGGHNSPSHWLSLKSISNSETWILFQLSKSISNQKNGVCMMFWGFLVQSFLLSLPLEPCRFDYPAPPSAALNHELLVILVHREWCGLFADQMPGVRMDQKIQIV